MSSRVVFCTVTLIYLARPVVLQAQNTLARTITVDPSGNADETSIQNAVGSNRIGSNPTVRWTVLIYAGTYAENVVLDDTKENVDLVGVDPDAVIIAPTSGDGVVIKGSGVRNNAVRNLKIVTNDDSVSAGRGIVIAHEGAGVNPSDITIENVTITTQEAGSTGVLGAAPVSNVALRNLRVTCQASTSPGIDLAETAQNVTISGSMVTTTSGNGIRFARSTSGAADPNNITIQGTTVTAGGSTSNGVELAQVEGFRLLDTTIVSDYCAVLITEGTSNPPKDLTFERTTMRGSGSVPAVKIYSPENLTILTCDAEATSSTGIELRSRGPMYLRMSASRVQGASIGMSLAEADDVQISDSTIIGGTSGLEVSQLVAGSPVCRVQNSQLLADATSASQVHALRHDFSSPDVLTPVELQGCYLRAINRGSGPAEPVFGDGGKLLLRDCVVVAENLGTGGASAIEFGLNAADWMRVVGGSLSSAAANEKQDDVFDIDVTKDPPRLFVSGTQFTTWRGPVFPADTPRTVTQNFLAVSNAADDAVYGTVTLDDEPQEITKNNPALSDPDVYRVLKIVGSGTFDDDATFYSIGTNWAGATITDAVTLAAGTNPSMVGAKPFKTVTKLIIPATEQQTPPSVTFGTTNLLGLSDPIGTASDVLEWSKLTGGAGNSYVVQDRSDLDGQINVELGEANTIELPSSPAGASFTFTYLTP
jgi:hypothetical protein